ncbi:hypothetical protein D9M68_933530 [compost metagenome]
MGHALVGALVFQAHLATLADNRGDGIGPQFAGLLNRPVHPFAPRQALAQMDVQRRLGQTGEDFA